MKKNKINMKKIIVILVAIIIIILGIVLTNVKEKDNDKENKKMPEKYTLEEIAINKYINNLNIPYILKFDNMDLGKTVYVARKCFEDYGEVTQYDFERVYNEIFVVDENNSMNIYNDILIRDILGTSSLEGEPEPPENPERIKLEELESVKDINSFTTVTKILELESSKYEIQLDTILDLESIDIQNLINYYELLENNIEVVDDLHKYRDSMSYKNQEPIAEEQAPDMKKPNELEDVRIDISEYINKDNYKQITQEIKSVSLVLEIEGNSIKIVSISLKD